ncbi:MAG TPA: hypothetical protein VHG93_10905 [Longimicrobium sp.]|nr:hypothetical protein [Longimicrobium sp.]
MRTALKYALACCTLAAVLGAAPAANAQESVSRAELQGSGATNLFDAVARLRPDWLFLAGDTADAAARERVLVFLDGRHVGSLNTLRTVDAANVGSIRVRSREFVRRTMPRFPRQDFAAALFVSTYTPEFSARERVSVRVRAGMQMISQARGASRAYDDEGFDDTPTEPTHNFADPGTETPATVGASVHVRLRPRLGVEVVGQHTFDGWTSGLDYARGVFNATLNSTEGAVLATYTSAPFRVGVGPAYRQTNWTYHPSFLRRDPGRKLSSSGWGGAANLVITLAQGRVFGEFALQGAHYAEETPRFDDVPPVPAGQNVVSSSLGLGLRF